MSSKKKINEPELALMQQRIDEGILLAQHRLLDRAQHDGLSLIICQGGVVADVPAQKIQWKERI